MSQKNTHTMGRRDVTVASVGLMMRASYDRHARILLWLFQFSSFGHSPDMLWFRIHWSLNVPGMTPERCCVQRRGLDPGA